MSTPPPTNAPSDRSEERRDLFASIYEELRNIAQSMFFNQAPGHILQPTVLVHEAYLRVVQSKGAAEVESREHALALGAKAMRQVLINHARDENAQKRGGGWKRLTLSGLSTKESAAPIDAIALEEALSELEVLDNRQCKILELRYFGGLTVQEVASALSLSPRTVEVDTRMAKLWLLSRLGAADAPGDAGDP